MITPPKFNVAEKLHSQKESSLPVRVQANG